MMHSRAVAWLLVGAAATVMSACSGDPLPPTPGAPGTEDAAGAVPHTAGGEGGVAAGDVSGAAGAVTSDAPALLNGEFAERPEDADGDGLYETLWVDAGVDVRRAGPYQVTVRLGDADGNFLASGQVALELPVGPSVAAIPIDGRAIRVADVDGPYRVIGADLFAQGPSGAILDRTSLVDVHETAPYRSRDFAAPGLEIDGPVSDEAVDRDGDGAVDAVSIAIAVLATEAGTYALSASLDSSAFQYFAFAKSEPVELGPGEHQIALVFDGLPLRSYGVDGPYELSRLVATRLDEDGEAALIDRWNGTYATRAYEAGQFAPLRSQ